MDDPTIRESNSGLTVAVVMLTIIVGIFGTLFLMESKKTKLDQSMIEEFILRQQSERDLGTLTTLPQDRGVLITNKVMYANSTEVLKAALENEKRQQQPVDPLTNFLGASGRPYSEQLPNFTVEEMLDTM
jgi:hypothetical protein